VASAADSAVAKSIGAARSSLCSGAASQSVSFFEGAQGQGMDRLGSQAAPPPFLISARLARQVLMLCGRTTKDSRPQPTT
jgi:hypothetical protein